MGRAALAGALAAAVFLVGCGHKTADRCSVTCGTGDLCPEGTSCGGDGYCHAADDTDDCALVLDRPDGAPGDADAAATGDADPCAGADGQAAATDPRDVAIPDGTAGVNRTIALDVTCVRVATVEVRVEIVHAYRGDVEISLTSPAGDTALVLASSDDSLDNIFQAFEVDIAAGEDAAGDWVLHVEDVVQPDAGILQLWSIGINRPAP